jgi:hypothetical protein
VSKGDAMPDRLATYLNDHLAGSRFALDLLARLQGAFGGDALGEWARRISAEIENDRNVLQSIVEKLDSQQDPLKEAAGWVAEKASQIKLALDTRDELGVFEALEALSLGVLGKRALWTALSSIAPKDHRLQGIDFGTLITRAQEQFQEVEGRRIEAAHAALTARRPRHSEPKS